MLIGKPEIINCENQTMYRCQVEFSEGTQTLWYSFEREFGDFVSDFSDGPLVALLIPAMAHGEDIRVSGCISERLMYNLAGPFQEILKRVIPSLHSIHIYPDEIQTRYQRAAGVATGFSCGIDSYCVLADHYYSDVVPDGFKITHLLYNNVGSHGRGGERLFKNRVARIEPIADRLGLPFIKVNSNIVSFYGDLKFQQTHTLRNASVPLILQGGIGRFLYATGYGYDEVFIGPSTAIAYIDPISLPLLSTEVVDLVSVGGQYSRVEKTLKVAEIPHSYNSLEVCVTHENVGNCSICY